jgi:hypothetical protein
VKLHCDYFYQILHVKAPIFWRMLLLHRVFFLNCCCIMLLLARSDFSEEKKGKRMYLYLTPTKWALFMVGGPVASQSQNGQGGWACGYNARRTREATENSRPGHV